MQPPQPPQLPPNPQQPTLGQLPQQGPYGGPAYPPPSPSPSSDRRALIWALAAIGAVVVVAVAIVLAVQPWKKGAAGVQTFELDRAISVDVRVPAGWKAQEVYEDSETGVMLSPSEDSRTWDQLNRASTRLRQGQSADPVHVVFMYASSCSVTSIGTWEQDDFENRSRGKSQQVERRMLWRVQDNDCVRMQAVDLGATSPSTEASDLALELANSTAVTPRLDSTRPSTRPSR